MATYRLLKRDPFSGGLQLDELKGYEVDFLLGRGNSLSAEYPKKAPHFTVDKQSVTKSGPERPGRSGKKKASTTLTDVLYYTDATILVVSEALKALIAPAEKKVEFLPVTIKGYAETYFILNTLDHVSCLDVKNSGGTVNKEGEVTGLKRLVLRDGDLPSDRALFQVKEAPALFLVSEPLAVAIEQAGLTGLQVQALADVILD